MHRLILISILILSSCTPESSQREEQVDSGYIQLSQNFLMAAKQGEDTERYADSLKKVGLNSLENFLSEDKLKLAFWLNIYNAYTQVVLKQNPNLFASRDEFFSEKHINIGGKDLSLDFIEHKILRRSEDKGNEEDRSFQKKFQVDSLDYRIHFALNCGAKSCPPIASYDPKVIDKQLDLATRTYLKAESEYQPLNNTVLVPALMDWFKADFGGNQGSLRILKDLNIIPLQSRPTIKFKAYDWTLYLDNYNSINNE